MGASKSKAKSGGSNKNARKRQNRKTMKFDENIQANGQKRFSLNFARSKTDVPRRRASSLDLPPPPPPVDMMEESLPPPPPPPSNRRDEFRRTTSSPVGSPTSRRKPSAVAKFMGFGGGGSSSNIHKQKNNNKNDRDIHNNNSDRDAHPVDPTFVDYTVVPLLLRSGMSYDTAQVFSEALKTKYSDEEVKRMMQDPDELWEIIVQEGCKVPNSFRKRLETDRFWLEAKSASSSDKRKSYVYFRDNPDTRKSMSRNRQSQVQQMSRPRPRSQFQPSRNDMLSTQINEVDIENLAALVKQNDSFRKLVKSTRQ